MLEVDEAAEQELHERTFDAKTRAMFSRQLVPYLVQKYPQLVTCTVCRSKEVRINDFPCLMRIREDSAATHLLRARLGQDGARSSPLIGQEDFSAAEARAGDEPMIMVVCMGCGHYRFHSLGVLGVDWDAAALRIAMETIADVAAQSEARTNQGG